MKVTMRLKRDCWWFAVCCWLLSPAAAVRSRWFLVACRSELLFTGKAVLERRGRAAASLLLLALRGRRRTTGERNKRGGEERRATSPLVLAGNGGERWVAASPEMANKEETRKKRRGWGAADLERRKLKNLGLDFLVD
ncbi:hypothetical protein KY285_027057 [Solanum tuberosum]|nr:hypothetical protein KY285_027057 [Solanum tuberosum]